MAKSNTLCSSSSWARGITPEPSASSTSARSSSAERIVSPAITSVIPNGRSTQRPRALQDPDHRPQHLRQQLDRPRHQRRQRLRAVERQRLRARARRTPRSGRSRARTRSRTRPSPAASRRRGARIAGSPTAPVRMPIAVIPTWTVEITRTGSSISRSADSAPRPPRARSGPRRAVTIEYSPITKKALPPISASRARMRKKIVHEGATQANVQPGCSSSTCRTS